MRIKKFVAPTMKEATDKMKHELGGEAIILNTRKVANGKHFNFLGKEMLEVTAAVDDQPTSQRGEPARQKHGDEYRRNDAAFNRFLERPETGKNDGTDSINTFEGLKSLAERFSQNDAFPEKRTTKSETPRFSISAESADFHQLRTEVEDMNDTLKAIAEHLKYTKMPALPQHLQHAYITLVRNDVDEQLAADLVQSIYSKLDESQLNNRQTIEKSIIGELMRIWKTVQPAKDKSKRTRIIALVGPTGVGKTTTIAKLAAIGKLVNRLDVGLISADTYRIGAIEQLRTFASIADIPMEVVYKPSEVNAAIRKFRNKDIIFVDTVGRSQRMKRELSELKRFVQAVEPDEIHLVISSSTNERTMADVVDRFAVLKPNRIIISKLDEASALGSMLNVVLHAHLPVSFVTTGQAVPDDIQVADSDRLARMIYPGIAAHA